MNVINILENGMTNITGTFSMPNSGGCGLIAQAMANVLAKLDVEVKVVLVSSPGTMMSKRIVDSCIAKQDAKDINDYFDKILPNWTRSGSPDPLNRHLAIEVDGQLYDSDGKFRGSKVSEALSPATLAALIAAPCWNDDFKYANGDIEDIPAEMMLQVTNQFNETE